MKAVVTAVFLIIGISQALGICIRNGVRCIDYTVVYKNEVYEERSYPSVTWVSATQNGISKNAVTRGLVMQLYGYFDGSNDQGIKLNKTVPYRTKKVVHEDYNTYTMSIALEPERSENPPQPLNPRITIEREPPTIYVARSFGGYVRRDSTWDHHAEVLKEAVADDEAVDKTFYYISVYDTPWRETGRLNEVWMIKNSSEK